MLDQSMKDQLKGVFASLEHHYIFRVTISENHPERAEMIALLQDVAASSDHLSLELVAGEGLLLEILKDGEKASFSFFAVPNGHEFTTLLLAILNLDGKGKNFPDEDLAARIRALNGGLVRSYISLTCTNCPEVVQALNMIAILNPLIRHEIIDGALFQDEVKKLNIQAVPSVYLDDKSLSVGRAGIGELLTKLESQLGSNYQAPENIEKQYDVIVVGGGPAGTAAAIYSARKGLKVAIVAERQGGQILETVGIENMISVARTTGKDLALNLREHLNDYPVDMLENRRIREIRLTEEGKVLYTSLGEKLIAPAVIIATGASWRRLNVPGENDYIGAGIAFCTHCDGPFYKDKKVAVVGGGNSGLEAAIDLSAIATEVTVLEFADELKGDQVLQDKLATLPNVQIHKGVATQEIIGDGNKVTALRYQNRITGDNHQLELDGVFVQIGLRANSEPFDALVETNRMGEILTDAYCRTNVPGIYAAGDVSTVPYKQIIIAMGEGAKAALSAFDDRIKGKLN